MSSTVSFSDLSLSADMLSALDEMGYVNPTPVQESSVPMVATGRDLMVQSQTGTGKTAAFGIPMLDSLGDKPQGVKALVLCPTRELAKQVAEEFTRLCQFKKIQTVAVYGGASMEKQIAEMRFGHVVVGTPGRVLDHLRRKTLKLQGLRTLILDEADEMLSMGFARELEQIMSFVPTERQTLLFSATIPEDIKRYAKRYMKEPEFLSLIEENVAADDVEHHYYMVSGVARPRDLIQVIEYENPTSAIVFTNTRKDTEIVARYLRKQGLDAEYLNGDLAQRERERIMGLMKTKSLRFLVATDIAARGIDISELSHVINYILPESPEVYIHRTGRTGRAGAKGTAVSLIGPREIGVYYYLKRIYNVALQEREIPSKAEVALQQTERRTESLVKRILDTVGGAPNADKALKSQTLRILEREDSVEVVQALLQVFKEGGTRKSAPGVGGVLADVPKPGRVAPGSRAATLQGVADRVAIVRGEFRGPVAKKDEEPRRRRRRRDPADEILAPTPAPATVEMDPEPAEAQAPTQARRSPESDDEPRQSRRSRKTKDEAPKQARRSRKSEEAPRADESAEEAPKRTRRSRKSEDAPAAKAESTEEAPKRSHRSRKRDDEPKAEPKAAAPKAAEAEEKPRRNRKKAEDAPAKPERETRKRRELAADEARLFVNLGKRDDQDSEQLGELLADLAGLLPEDILDVDVRARHSYVVVAKEFAEDLLEAVDGETVSDREVRVELARE